VVDSPPAELAVLEVAVQFSRELEIPVVSRFEFSPLLTSVVLSSMSLDASHKSEDPSLALVSTVTGFGSFGTSPYQSSFTVACLAPQLRPEGFSKPIFAPSQVCSGVAELGERLRSSALVLSVSKPF